MPDGVRHSPLLVRRLDSPGISGSHALRPVGRLQQAAIGALAFPLPRYQADTFLAQGPRALDRHGRD